MTKSSYKGRCAMACLRRVYALPDDFGLIARDIMELKGIEGRKYKRDNEHKAPGERSRLLLG